MGFWGRRVLGAMLLDYQLLALCVFAAMFEWCCCGQVQEDRGIQVGRSVATGAMAGGSHLLAIGINDYLHWPKLKSAVNDAEEVARVLQDQYAFESRNTILLKDSQATRPKIIETLRHLAETLKEDDSLFVFYAGHGHLDSVTKTGSWIPVEADTQDTSSWLDNAQIKNYLRAMKARHVLLVSDSCFAADFFEGNRGITPQITDAYVRTAFARASRQAITSGGLEPVSDAGAQDHSVFTFFLLKLLKENRSPYLLPSDLFSRIKGGVAVNAAQQPQLGILTGTGGELGGEYVLFRKGAGGSMDAAMQQKKEELTILERREAEALKASQVQQEELDAKAESIKKMDDQIAAMQKKLGEKETGGGTLDQLVALVEQKELQAKEMDRLRQKADQEKKEREAEIERLRQKETADRKAAFESDMAKFDRVVESQYVTDEIKQQAWQTLCQKWNVTPRSKTPGKLYWDGGKITAEMPNKPTVKGNDSIEPATLSNKDKPFENSLGMRFVLVIEKSRNNKVLFCQWETRVRDFRAFVRDTVNNEGFNYKSGSEPFVLKFDGWKQRGWDYGWENPGFKQTEEHPVACVSWEDATAFCKWLTLKERLERKIGPNDTYRLPTDAEWSEAAGNAKYHWGNDQFPPPAGGGNFAGAEAKNIDWPTNFRVIEGWRDECERTSSVGKFTINKKGLYDMGGNVWEWCEDWYRKEMNSEELRKTYPFLENDGNGKTFRVLRGASWCDFNPGYLSSSYHTHGKPGRRGGGDGFRVVLVVESSAR